MAKVTIYTRDFCPYCTRALGLLTAKHAEFTEINAGRDASLKAEMVARSAGRATFPQIFIGERHIGGCDDLHALNDAGELDALLVG